MRTLLVFGAALACAVGAAAEEGQSVGGGPGITIGQRDKNPSANNASSGKGGAGGGGGNAPEKTDLQNDDACKGLPPQGRTTALAQITKLQNHVLVPRDVLNGKAPPDPTEDAIDLRTVIFVKGVAISGWNKTSTIKDVKPGGGSLCIEHTMSNAESWLAQFFDEKDTKVEGNQWVFAFIDGRWYGGAGEWIRPGQTCKSVDSANVGCGVFYDSEPLKSWRPAHGELVGIAVSAPARAGQWAVAARSNVVLVRWP